MGGLQQTHLPSSGLMTKQSEKAEQQLLNSGISSSQKSFFPSGGLPTQGEENLLYLFFSVSFALILIY